MEKLMRFVLLIIVGLVSGLFAGMGMGGGTFLVPLLSIVFRERQIVCQSTNIFCFIVLATICIVIYSKKKLIDFRVVLFVGLPAMIISSFFTILSIKIQSKILRIIFGFFVMIIGFFNIFLRLLNKNNK